MTEEIYISTDIEADGPIPGEYSMLSIGSVAINKEGKILGEFYKKLKPLPDAKQHPETMQFWKENPEAWKEATTNQEEPEAVIKEYVTWLNKFRSKESEPRFTAWPATYDFLFTYWYIMKFSKDYNEKFWNENPLAFSGLDIRTYAMALLKKSYIDTNKDSLPERWTKDTGEHTHKAIDDARQHGEIFINMLKENQK